MSKYDNYKTFLTGHGFTVTISDIDFHRTKTIVFDCPLGHSTTLKCTSFSNKKSKMDNPLDLCTTCTDAKACAGKLDSVKDDILRLTGHELLEFKNNKDVTFRCGKCSSTSNSTLANLYKNSGSCKFCQNANTRNTFEKIQREIAEFGFGMVLSKPAFEASYKNKDHPIKVRCKCGEVTEMRFGDICQGKQCMGCRNDRMARTNMDKYGVANTFQVPEFKEKIVATNMVRYGVSYPQQNQEIFSKTKATCNSKFGKEFAFTQDWVFEKIRQTHLINWGVKFPFQNQIVQAKTEEICLRKLGVRRPLMSQKIQDLCKQSMVDRYGTPHPLQVPEFFHKAMKTAFSTKPYTFPSGRVENVMGYEPYVIDHLLQKSLLKEEDISVGEQVPFIKYCDEDGKKRMYYPDIFIKSSNTIIEVKSIWTFNMCPVRNFLKMINVAQQGFESVLFIVNAKKILDILTFTSDSVTSRRIKDFDYTQGYPLGNVEEPSDEDAEAIVDETIMETIEDEVIGAMGEDAMCDQGESEAGPSNI